MDLRGGANPIGRLMDGDIMEGSCLLATFFPWEDWPCLLLNFNLSENSPTSSFSFPFLWNETVIQSCEDIRNVNISDWKLIYQICFCILEQCPNNLYGLFQQYSLACLKGIGRSAKSIQVQRNMKVMFYEEPLTSKWL